MFNFVSISWKLDNPSCNLVLSCKNESKTSLENLGVLKNYFSQFFLWFLICCFLYTNLLLHTPLKQKSEEKKILESKKKISLGKSGEFRCHIDTAEQQRTLNFESLVSDKHFLSSFSRLQVIQNKCPWCLALVYVT